MPDLSPHMAKKAKKLFDYVEAIMADVLPPPCHYSLPAEIAHRIEANFRIVGTRGLRDQILIVLGDYHDHNYASGKLKYQGDRISIADRIMRYIRRVR